jgi:hypothetical protein
LLGKAINDVSDGDVGCIDHSERHWGRARVSACELLAHKTLRSDSRIPYAIAILYQGQRFSPASPVSKQPSGETHPKGMSDLRRCSVTTLPLFLMISLAVMISDRYPPTNMARTKPMMAATCIRPTLPPEKR